MTHLERIATFAAAARPGHLRGDIRQLLKRNILDGLGCTFSRIPTIQQKSTQVRHRCAV